MAKELHPNFRFWYFHKHLSVSNIESTFLTVIIEETVTWKYNQKLPPITCWPGSSSKKNKCRPSFHIIFIFYHHGCIWYRPNSKLHAPNKFSWIIWNPIKYFHSGLFCNLKMSYVEPFVRRDTTVLVLYELFMHAFVSLIIYWCIMKFVISFVFVLSISFTCNNSLC